jgi:hypothetical protein
MIRSMIPGQPPSTDNQEIGIPKGKPVDWLILGNVTMFGFGLQMKNPTFVGFTFSPVFPVIENQKAFFLTGQPQPH